MSATVECPSCDRRMAMLLEYERRAYVAEGRIAALLWFLQAEGDVAIEAYARELSIRRQQEDEDCGPSFNPHPRYDDAYRDRVASNRKALNKIMADVDAAYLHYKRAVVGIYHPAGPEGE